MGSLTTPPCSEGVNWFVSTARLRVATTTFQKVRDIIGFNSRFPQNAPGEPNLLAVAAAGGAPAVVAAPAAPAAEGAAAAAPAASFPVASPVTIAA